MRRLEHENNKLKNELGKVKDDMKLLSDNNIPEKVKDKNTVPIVTPNTGTFQNQYPTVKMTKIMVVVNKNMKGMITLLKTYTDYEYDINSHYITNWQELGNISVLFAQKMNKGDFLIILDS